MAEKVSAKPSATSVGPADYFYLVQAGASKKVSASVLFKYLANAELQGTFRVTDTKQTLTSPGTISVTNVRTEFQSDAIGGVCQIPTGQEGQIKTLYMSSTAGGAFTLNANLAGGASVSFEKGGHTAMLQYLGSSWFVLSGTANIVL